MGRFPKNPGHWQKELLALRRREGAAAMIGKPFGDPPRGATGRRRARRYARKIIRAFRDELLATADDFDR
jgi:hypothetical protein